MSRHQQVWRRQPVSVKRHQPTPVDTGRHRSRSAFNPRVPGSIPGRPTGQPASTCVFALAAPPSCVVNAPAANKRLTKWLTDGLAGRSTQLAKVGREVVRPQLGADCVPEPASGPVVRSRHPWWRRSGRVDLDQHRSVGLLFGRRIGIQVCVVDFRGAVALGGQPTSGLRRRRRRGPIRRLHRRGDERSGAG